MKTQLFLFALLLTSVTTTVLVYGQGEKKPRTPADYKPRTLREFSTLQPEYIATDDTVKNSGSDLNIVVHADLLPTRVKATYEGTTRPLHEKRKLVIKQWANHHAGAVESYTLPYQTEALFTENGENYWLAVRSDSLPKFDQELKKGEPVELFLIKMGNIRIDSKLEPVILVENFTKQ